MYLGNNYFPKSAPKVRLCQMALCCWFGCTREDYVQEYLYQEFLIQEYRIYYYLPLQVKLKNTLQKHFLKYFFQLRLNASIQDCICSSFLHFLHLWLHDVSVVWVSTVKKSLLKIQFNIHVPSSWKCTLHSCCFHMGLKNFHTIFKKSFDVIENVMLCNHQGQTYILYTS